MTTPLERSASLTIGSIESVAPNEFKVQLDTDAPQATALNTGSPVAFPRINSYVLVPGQGGAVVGQVTWIGIERSEWPKRKGLKDFGPPGHPAAPCTNWPSRSACDLGGVGDQTEYRSARSLLG